MNQPSLNGPTSLPACTPATAILKIKYIQVRMRYINRTIWILSLVSLFMDLASEMLYPVVPVYLRSIGFSLLWIGLLEGLAEFTVSLDRKSTRLNSSHIPLSRMPSSA